MAYRQYYISIFLPHCGAPLSLKLKNLNLNVDAKKRQFLILIICLSLYFSTIVSYLVCAGARALPRFIRSFAASRAAYRQQRSATSSLCCAYMAFFLTVKNTIAAIYYNLLLSSFYCVFFSFLFFNLSSISFTTFYSFLSVYLSRCLTINIHFTSPQREFISIN